MIINTNTMSAAQMQSLQKELVQKAGPISPGRGEVHIDTYLTNLSVAVMQDPMGFVADMVSPGIPVQKQSGNIAGYRPFQLYTGRSPSSCPWQRISWHWSQGHQRIV